MRKVILQMYVTLDGFIAGPNGEMDWIFSAAGEESGKAADQLLDSVDVILLGRVMSKEFLDYWPEAEKNPALDKSLVSFAKKINARPKIIFSKTMDTITWPNVRVVKAHIAEEIAKMKEEPGKNLILYGGAGLAQTFMNLDLIDDYHLFVAPIALGKGLSLFDGLKNRLPLKLVDSKTTKSGVSINHYQPIR
jgi:dihydrofolate reductase